jgi:drug/metabolite transporter (DMT)-like permease
MAIFGKLAYRHGANVPTLLTLRFALAAVVLWLIAVVRRAPLPPRRTVTAGAGLGLGYAVQAGCYFAALRHLEASMTSLLLYTYPALVFCAAVALGRERATAVKVCALLLAAAGAVLVLLGGGTGALDPTGVALALGAALAYTTYILVADTAVGDADPIALTAIVITAAGIAFALASPAVGGFDPALGAAGWAGVVGVALVSTVLAATAFLLGLERVGPSTASIVSTVEPAVTVALAAVTFGERLGAVQLAGGVLVLSAVVVLQLRAGRVSPGAAPDHAAPAAAARPVSEHAS